MAGAMTMAMLVFYVRYVIQPEQQVRYNGTLTRISQAIYLSLAVMIFHQLYVCVCCVIFI